MPDVTVGTIGTTHPYASAGVLLDLAVFRALGVRGVAVIAGVSAQDAGSVRARRAIDAATVAAQFAALAAVRIDAWCVGALLDAGSVAAVAAGLAQRPGVPVICDPVIAASGGDRLADDATVAALCRDLFARCTLLTPNLDEAELLTGSTIGDLAAMESIAPRLRALGPHAVLLKGGHLAGDACDVFADGERIVTLRAARLPHELRGTGSLLAAAVAARVAHGDALLDAVTFARAFVRERIATGVSFGGMRVAY